MLSPKRVGAHLRQSGIAEMTDTDASNMRLLQWVSHVENAHQFTIYQADSAEGNWSQLAIRRADKVIFVAFADGGSHIREIEAWAAPQHEDLRLSIGLILVHEASTVRPFDTARWLKDRNIGSIYHLREDSREDMGRLARRLAGKPVSLVLGGGGARAWAHIGVIRACEDLGIPIDIVGGTSMGGAIATFKAQGLSAAELFEECIRISRNIKDYTLPIASIMSGKRIYRHIDMVAGRWDIEDLWLPFFSVSTNITTAHAVCHRSGNLGLALRATLAIPGVFPPVVDGRNLLVDGGVLHNLPVEFMRDINPTGSIIAIDVLPRTGPRAKYDYGIHLSGWEILWSRIAPWRKTIQMPSIPGAILRSMFIGSSVAQHKIVEDELADLYINIDVRGIGMLEFDAIERIESIGYEKSIRQLEQWAQA